MFAAKTEKLAADEPRIALGLADDVKPKGSRELVAKESRP